MSLDRGLPRSALMGLVAFSGTLAASGALAAAMAGTTRMLPAWYPFLIMTAVAGLAALNQGRQPAEPK